MLINLRLLATTIVAFFVFAIATPGTLAQVQTVAAGQVLISELRFRGPLGAEDEFIELYNNTDQAITVRAVDASPGWGVAISNGLIAGTICVVPNGTVIPARGHYLCANTNGYSLSGYPSGSAPMPTLVPMLPTTPDSAYQLDIADGFGVALFKSAFPLNQNTATRLDAFGFTDSPALYKEGTGFTTINRSNREHTYYRDMTGEKPKDTNDNAADFKLVGTVADINGNLLGAPSPKNLKSPMVRGGLLISLLDPTVGGSVYPNSERRPNYEPNANLGVLLLRRKVTNNTGYPVTRLRFRVTEIITMGTPSTQCGLSTCADVRALSSIDGESVVAGQIVTVKGLKLEQNAPMQPNGGGYNSTLSADFITMDKPLGVGQSIYVEFKLGVMKSGLYRFYVAAETQRGE